ncbi:MAG: hypothetical protein MMC33_010587 [Icmadophila ericetorum]|nr:hypothetical protein [Icmadophila ericetorum]
MKLSTVLLTPLFLFITSVICAPKAQIGGHGLGYRLERRREARLGHPLIPTKTAETSALQPNGNISNIQYSSNWAGAVLTAPPAGSTFNSVSGTFTVPTPAVPSGNGAGSYSASAWVGIDGDTYQNSILQTGCDFTVTKSSSGSLSYNYQCWYEWYPNYAIDFPGITIAAGNSVTVSVHSTSSTKGTATIVNHSNGESATVSVSSSAALGGQNAEWIVEDYEEGSSLVPFANFGTVTFTSASAGDSAGGTVGTSSATIIEIENSSGQVITDVSIPNNGEVVVQYV